MSDFKKGLLVGMLIIIGCGVFVANKSNDGIGRYTLFEDEGGIVFMLDTKNGDFYSRHGLEGSWLKRYSIDNNTKSK